MKKIVLIICSVIVVLAIGGWVFLKFYPETVVPYVMRQQIKVVASNTSDFFEKDAIVVITVGTATPLPGKRAQTGTAVFVNGKFFMFDVGAGVVQKSENFRLPLRQLNGVFLTHYHSDHIMDLPNIISRSWVMGRKNDLHVYGPDGLKSLVKATTDFLQIENQYRVDHHGPKVMDTTKANAIPHEFHVAQNASKVVYKQDGVTITAFDVNHEPIEPAVGFLIEYKGKKVVISGDTKKNALLEKMAQNCDLLVHEVLLMPFQKMLSKELEDAGMNRNAGIIHDIQEYHIGAREVAALAQRAKVKKLVLNHLGPAPDNFIIRNMYNKELKGYDGPIHLADDGDKFIVK